MALINIGFFSDVLGMCVDCCVLLPQTAEGGQPAARRTLYLLHGAFGGNADWLRYTNVERYIPHDMAVVMPAAHMSCYADMAHGGRYFSYIADELPEKMHVFFPLSDRREDTFIAGLSMGGMGALKIGLARFERFGAIGCFSAGAYNDVPAIRDFLPLVYDSSPQDGTPEDIYGSLRRAAASGKPCPRIYHAIGTEDALLCCARDTRDVIRALPGDPFGYTYVEAPGGHQWDFWDAQLRCFLTWLDHP